MLGRAVRIGIFRVNCFQIRRIARFPFSCKKEVLVVCRDCGLIMKECEGVKVRDLWFCNKCFCCRWDEAVRQVFKIKR